MLDVYKSYFDYWLENSDNVCDCCIFNENLKCDADNCEYYRELTKEECEEKGLSLDISKPGVPEKWTCQNTDDCEFCAKVNNSPCRSCIDSHTFKKFVSNGLIK